MKLTVPVVALAALAVGFGVAGRATGAARVVVVPKCPSHAPKFEATLGTSNPFVQPNAQFLQLCRYYKNNWATGQTLWRKRTIGDRPLIARLTRAFNRLQEPPRGIFCVKDDGSEMLLIFAYADTLKTAGVAPERVVVKLSGCRFASNGDAVRSTTAWLHKRLLSLVNQSAKP